MAEIQVLGPQAIRQLREIARRVLREEQGANFGQSGRQHDYGADVFVLKTSTAGITGRSTNTAGSGDCTVYYRSTANVLTQASTLARTVYNMTTNSVNSGIYIQAKQDNFGTLWIDTEACVGST